MNAIVTGATKGIGRAIVMHLAANNFNVSLCARNEREIETLLRDLSSRYPRQNFYGISADMEHIADVMKFADFSHKCLSTTHVLINNAGLFIPSELMKEGATSLERQMKVNVYAPHYLSKYFAEKMIAAGHGHIINICSIASIRPVISAASYSVTKMALLGLTKVMREELIPHGIRVTAILPGSTLTDSWAGTSLPPQRFIDPEDVAKSVINCMQMSAGANIDEIIIRPLQGDI